MAIDSGDDGGGHGRREMVNAVAALRPEYWPTVDEVQETLRDLRQAERQRERQSWALTSGSRKQAIFESQRLQLKNAARNCYWRKHVEEYEARLEGEREKERQLALRQELGRQELGRQKEAAEDLQALWREQCRLQEKLKDEQTRQAADEASRALVSPPYVYQPFPKWKFHISGRSVIVEDIPSERALGLWWFDSPARAQKVMMYLETQTQYLAKIMKAEFGGSKW